MKKCPYCGYANKDQNQVCEQCKAALPHETTEEQTEPDSADDGQDRVLRRKTRS